MERDKTQRGDTSKPTLFTMSTVNSYGSADIEHLKDDGKPLKLSGMFLFLFVCLLLLASLFLTNESMMMIYLQTVTSNG